MPSPALFAVELGLARLWQSWGVEPEVVLGHSVGQYAAACVAGVFDIDDGIRLVAERGRLFGQLPAGGRMMAVFTDADRVEERVAEHHRLSVAAYNGASTVVSGPAEDLEDVAAFFAQAGMRCEWLNTSHAFHSGLLEPALDEFETRAGAFGFSSPRLALVCNRTGDVVSRRTTLDAQYWRRHARQPVRFADSVATLARLGCTVLMELGPQPILSAAAMRAWPEGRPAPQAIASMRRDTDSRRSFTEALAQAYTAGHTLKHVDSQTLPRRTVDLPTYPFQHRDYWFSAYTAPDLERRARAGSSWSDGPRLAPVAAGHTTANDGIALVDVAPEHRLDHLTDLIRGELGAALRAPPSAIDPDAEFISLGMDSLIALDLCRRLQGRLGMEVPAAVFFAHPTTASLAEGLLATWGTEPEGMRLASSIARALRNGRVPLSHAQEQLWFLNELLPSSSAYNVAARVDIGGAVDRGLLQRSLEAVIARHDALRTTFHGERGVPHAMVAPAGTFELPFEPLHSADELSAAVRREAAIPFDIAVGPLLRARLFELDGSHVLVFTMHHIVTDGWSFRVMLRELALIYDALARGAPNPLPGLPIQYPDYAAWQRDQLSGSAYDAHVDFWRSELAGAMPLELDTDRPRPKIPTFRGSRRPFALGRGRADAVRELCRSANVTVSVPLLAALAAVLQRYSGQDDIVVGTLTANRARAETEDMIGLFVNSLPVRLRLDGDPDVGSALDLIRQRMAGVLAHQDVPFDRIVAAIAPDREAARNPLFSVQLVVQPGLGGAEMSGLGLSVSEVDTQTAKRDLTVTLTDDEALSGHVEYASDLFDVERVERLISHFVMILDAMVADPGQRLSELPMLTESEQALYRLRRSSDGPAAESLPQLFEAVVDRTPDAVAVTDDSTSLTYRDLDSAANRVARRLQTLGISAGSAVGLRVDRTAAMVIGMLGVLKAGAVYVPIDPSYPDERVDAMLTDAGVTVLLDDDEIAAAEPESAQRLQTAITPDALAYVMYTSGSTGRPKGVAVSHGSVVEYVETLGRELGITADDVYLETASMSFSSSIRQILVPLAAGARLVIASAQERRDPAALLARIAASAVTVADLVPTVVRAIVDITDAAVPATPHLRLLLTASEPLRAGLVRAWRRRMGDRATWINMYGQTETTGIVSLHRVEQLCGGEEGIVPIGRPRQNVAMYVLDHRLRLVPPGVSGELFIGGTALARGYVNDPDLTAQKFTTAPWDSGMRLYATGDVVRLGFDGTVEFRNRADRQVKIRGLRVEPVEIDRVLLGHPGVAEVVTVAQSATSGAGDNVLVAYYSPTAESVPVGDLRAHARRELPEHMVPAAFMELHRLPQTPNGKLDRGALPDVLITRDEEIEYVAPRSGVEEALADIWRSTLGVQHIGAGDNFFALGGHSLLAAQVRSRIHQVLGIELPLDALFEDQTLADLARRIEESTAGEPEASAMVPIRRIGALPVSYAQELMWRAEQDAPGSPEHWIDVSIRISGALDASIVAQGVQHVCSRNALLRTIFRSSEQSVSQVVLDSASTETSIRDGAPDPLTADTADEWRDLDSRPPLRAEVFRIADDHHILRLRMHRILGDGYSTRLLFSEIGGFVADALGFDDYTPLDGKLQYADYAVWERSWLTGQALTRRIDHFRRQFDRVALPPALSTDRPRVDRSVRYGRQFEFEFPREVTAAARALAVGEQASLYSVLLAAFASAVGRHNRQRTVVLAAPVTRRNDRQTQLMLGPFMNSVPLLIDLDAAADLAGLVRAVKSTVLGALANQDAPWLHVLPALAEMHGAAAQRIGQVGFLMDDPVPGEFTAGGFRLTRVHQERVIARRDLTVSMTTKRGQISGMATYDDALFEPESIERIVADFIAALSSSSIERI